MPFDWKITRNRNTKVTTLEVFHPNGGVAATGTGENIWQAREMALAQTADVAVQNYITAHIFPDVE